MPEITTQLAFPLFKKIAMLFIGLISKKLQYRIFPFNESNIEIEIDNLSARISLNIKQNRCTITLYIKIKNYTFYDIVFLSAKCKLRLNNVEFKQLTETKVVKLAPYDQGQYVFEQNLNEYEVRKAQEFLSEMKSGSIYYETMDISFVAKTIYGEKNIDKQKFVIISISDY